MSYQYCSYLYYREIHLRRYICWYCTLIYKKFVILSCFILNCHRTFLFTQISNLLICGIFKHKNFTSDKAIHNLLCLIINNKFRHQVTVIKPRYHWKTENYQGLDDHGEGDLDSDLNHLDSGNLWQYTNIPSQCEKFPWTWTWSILYFDCWYHFENLPGSV